MTNLTLAKITLALGAFALVACQSAGEVKRVAAPPPNGHDLPRIVFDTDANNEVDDQHAIAYLLFNSHRWNVVGITTNATKNGGPVGNHTEEAKRVAHLASADQIPVLDGANGGFEEIQPHVHAATYDGMAAVDFLIEQSRMSPPLLIVAVGKLTNVALALAKDPSLAQRARLVWLGSNWPDNAGEYNEADDRAAVNYVFDSQLPVDIATVGGNSGTEKVTVSTAEIQQRMRGLGPKVSPVLGRHGGKFSCFGDYSIDLFEKAGEKTRSLFDMAAVAIVKNPQWAETLTVPAPFIDGEAWVARPQNSRKVRFLVNFNRDAIIEDFFLTMQSPKLPGTPRI